METFAPFDDDLTLSLKDLPTDSSKNPGVATLQPFIPDPLPQRSKNSRVKARVNEFETLPGIFEPASFSKFLTLKFDNDKRAQDLDMFTIEK